MKKLVKWIVGIAIVLALLLVTTVLLLPRFFDPNEHKPQIESRISEQIGRQVRLQGPIEWTVFPWLALRFEDMSVANEKGFAGEHLARADTLAARIKVLPLLKKQIRVGTVIIEGADINLQVARNGRSNWQGIIDTLTAESDAPASTDGSTIDLKVSGIEIRDSAIRYHNKAAALQAELANVDLATGRIETSQPVATTISATISLPDNGLTGKLRGQLQMENLLDAKDFIVRLETLTLDGSLDNGNGTVPLALSLGQPATLNIDTEILDMPEIRLRLANAELRTPVKGRWSGAGDYSGQLQADNFNLRKFLSALGGAPLAFASPDAMRAFSLQTPWRLQGNRLTLPKITAILDQTRIDGNLDLRDLARLQGQFSINLDHLDADDYLPADTPQNSTENPDTAPTGALDFGQLQGSMTLDELRVAGARFTNTRLNIVTNGGKIHITPMQADFYQGLLNTQVQVDINAPRNKVKLETRANKVHFGPLIKDIAGDEWLTGLGQLDINVALDDPFAPKPLKTAHGTVAYSLTDGAVYGVDMLATIKQAFTSLQQLRQSGRAAKKTEKQDVSGQAAGKGKKTEFARIDFLGEINQGVLTSRTLSIVTPFLQVGGRISIDLDAMRIDGLIEPMLTDIPDDWVDPKYRQLLNLPIPVRLSGSLTEPSVSIDLAKLLLATQKTKIDKKKKELKNKLLGKLLGEDKARDSKTGQPDNAANNKQENKNGEPAGDNENTANKKPESTEDKLKRKLLKGLFGDDG